jgi:endo-1,4-beta-xylanase
MDGEWVNGGKTPDRRTILGGLAAAAVPSAAIASPKGGLHESAARAGILFGSSIARDIDNDSAYRQLYRDETRLVTTDYALKFDAMRPNEERIRFEDTDRLLAFAQDNGMAFRGHTLVWNENAPAWLKAKPLSDIARIFDSHVETVASRYAGKVTIWDVVNEPFWPDHGKPGGYRDGPWLQALGKGYVAAAFRRVAAIDPKARLALNEAHTEHGDRWAATIRPLLLRQVDELLDAGVPLHAVGLQGHLDSRLPADDLRFAEFVREIAKRKVEIHITELDVNDRQYADRVVERDRQVAARVYGFLREVLTVPQVKIVTTWQLSDRYSWYADPDIVKRLMNGRRARPLPFDDQLRRKPMWQAIKRAFDERRPVV